MGSDRSDTETLTESQRALLESAVREGYFQVPKRVSLVELAEMHDISDVEASRRLRRALQIVIGGSEGTS